MELEFSQASPTLATYNGMVWVAYLSKTSDAILVNSSSDGINWSAHTVLVGKQSKSAPALCQTAFDNKLWMVYRGVANDEVLVCSWDGHAWSPDVSTNQTTKASPALAVYEGKLWVAFIANNDSDDILLCSSADGKTWSQTVVVPGQSSGMAPALAAFDGELWLAFIANNGSNDILTYAAKTPDGQASNWTARPTGLTSSAAPSLATGSIKLWLAFTAVSTGDLAISSWGGVRWSTSELVPNQTTQTGPAITVFPVSAGTLKLAFLSADVSNRLFTIRSEGPTPASWGPATVIGNYPDEITLHAGTATNTISYGGGNFGGVNPNQAQFFATLVLKSNGLCTFSGTYTNNGSLPVLTAYDQNYSVAIVILADGVPYSFEHGGTAKNANHDSWNVTTTNAQVAAHWPAIVQGTARANSTNNAPAGGILSAVWGALTELVSDAATVESVVVQVIGIVGGSGAAGASSGGAAVAAGA